MIAYLGQTRCATTNLSQAYLDYQSFHSGIQNFATIDNEIREKIPYHYRETYRA